MKIVYYLFFMNVIKLSGRKGNNEWYSSLEISVLHSLNLSTSSLNLKYLDTVHDKFTLHSCVQLYFLQVL